MSDEGGKGWLDKLTGGFWPWAKAHPNKAASLAVIGVLAWLVNQRPEVVTALIGTGIFKDMPSGWEVFCIILLSTAILHLYRKLERCERECNLDRDRIKTLESSQEELIERLFEGRPQERRQIHEPVEKERRRR